ncbi:MAG TPA: MFS transporter, partial [Micromonosporaceae bacterium]|nr:MFS transporter [Micromonosporaceae bacterium]
LLVAGLSLAILFVAIFAGVATGDTGALWVGFAFLAAATAFAFFQVPYVAMPAELTQAYGERTRLMAWRIAVLALAILVSGALAPLIRDAAGGGIAGHRWMGLFVAALIAAGALGAFAGTRGAPTGVVTAREASLARQLRTACTNPSFIRLLRCFVVQSAGIGAMLAGVQYFADHVLHRHNATTILFACFVGPALLVMPLWTWAGDRLGKKRAFSCASGLFAIGALALAAAQAVGPVAVYLATILIGCGYAGQQVFALAMLPDCIAYDEARTGRRQAGVFTGLWTAGETFGLALGPGIFGLVLQAFGYLPSSTGAAVPQSSRAELGVLLGFTVLPGVVVGAALVLMRGYDLTAEKLATR